MPRKMRNYMFWRGTKYNGGGGAQGVAEKLV